MARKAKEGTIDLYYLNSKNKKENEKARAKKNSPRRSKKGKRKIEQNTSNDDVFNFDNEIVIGINVIPDEKKSDKTKKNNKTRKNSKNTSKTNTNKKSNTNKKQNNERRNVNNKNKVQPKVKEQRKRQLNNQETENVDKHIKNYQKARVILKIFLIIILFAIVIVFLMTSPIFNINKINVSGNVKVSEEQIISLSQIEIETNTYKMNKTNVENNVKENAYIDSVKVTRKLPNQVNIEVTERKPQYMLRFGNAYVYISSQGYMLEISEEKLNTTIITGYSTPEEDIVAGNRLNQEDLKRLEIVLKIMESASNNEVATDISEIDISNINNFTLILESKNKIAYIGDASSINDKMIVLRQMIIKEEGKSGKAFLMDKDRMYFREE